jgi:quinoprotein dehydrogenase-associated probable ABC transporter substrate-binding protein
MSIRIPGAARAILPGAIWLGAILPGAIWLGAGLLAAASAHAGELESLTVCADPGNMPLSNQRGEGFENKIAQLIGTALGTRVQYYWRPSIERGLMRTTLGEGNCDVWMDMAVDTEGAAVLKPLYRSTFVFAYRSDKGISIKNFDDPELKKLRVGVFQVSAIREVLAQHHVIDNTVIHYLSHDADLEQDQQPSYQVQQVIDGALDVAAAWGPMAGYYRAILHAPITVQPVNLMQDTVPLEFDMALAVPRGRPDIRAAVEQALELHKDEIKRILTDYGVPLVECAECTVSGDLPSHGPYASPPPAQQNAAETRKERAKTLAGLRQSLAAGANANAELQNAIVAADLDRVRYLIAHGADVNARDGEGNTALINAVRFGFGPLADALLAQHADPNLADRASGWTPLMFAAWGDDAALVQALARSGAQLEARNHDAITALGIAAQNGKLQGAQALIAAGAQVNGSLAGGGYSPLMLATISGSDELVQALIAHGAEVNAANPGGVTALMIAAAGNHFSVASLLLRAGAEVGARSQDGRTALSIAQANNNAAVVKLLQEAAQKTAAQSG